MRLRALMKGVLHEDLLGREPGDSFDSLGLRFHRSVRSFVRSLGTWSCSTLTTGNEHDGLILGVESNEMVATLAGIDLVRIAGVIVEMVVVILGIGDFQNELIERVRGLVECISRDGRQFSNHFRRILPGEVS